MAMIKNGVAEELTSDRRVPMQRKYIIWLKPVCLKMMT